MNKDFQGEKIPPIYIVSGGKGLAGDAVVQSVLIQFPNNKVPVIVVPDVLNQERMDDEIDTIVNDCRKIINKSGKNMECSAVGQFMEFKL